MDQECDQLEQALSPKNGAFDYTSKVLPRQVWPGHRQICISVSHMFARAQGKGKKLKDRITPHMNLYESEGSKAQSSQSLNSFYNTALSGSDISFRQQRGGREGVRE